MKISQRLVIPLVALTMFIASAGSAQAATTLDQSFESGNTAQDINRVRAQMVTPGITGDLTSVQIQMYKSGTPGHGSEGVTASIRAVSAGLPTGPDLASGFIPDSDIQSSSPWKSVTFASPPSVTAGTPFAIVASTTNVSSAYFWDSDDVNSYSGGQVATFSNPTWTVDPPPRGMKFRTFVETTDPATLSTITLPTFTLSLDFGSVAAACTGGNPSGVQGTWVTVPTADQCSQIGADANGDASLLGWSTSPNFPATLAQSQVDQGWGVIDDGTNGVRMIFIPAGMSTLLSGDNTLFSIWSK